MTIHAWRHWFWITSPPHKVLALLLALQVAGLPPPPPDAAPQSVSVNVSDSSERRPRFDAPSTEGTNAVLGSNPRFSSDMDDTYNGESSDVIIPYPVKKYNTKYIDPSTGKKYKGKPKSEEASEKIIDFEEQKYQVRINRIESFTALPLPVPGVDLNATEATFNATEEPLSDDPLEGNVTRVQNETENYAEAVEVTTVETLEVDAKMAVAAATSVNHDELAPSGLDAASITGITLGIVVISGLFGAISFVLYRRRYLNKPQVLNDKSSTLDSSGYIDDTSLRENSEEMYSLDNDSFLNSLEAMTIQNYWTESVKHTKL